MKADAIGSSSFRPVAHQSLRRAVEATARELTAPRSIDDVVLYGPESRRRSVRHADLRVDVLDVMIGGLRGDVEPLGDLARREPLSGEA